MVDYTRMQNAPIADLKGFPAGKEAVEINKLSQDAFQKLYGSRPEYVHLIAKRSNRPWHISYRREHLINKYPNDKMVFVHYADKPDFLGWLYFKEIRDNWHETAIGHELTYPLRTMETFTLVDET
jgi:hypothetical protein